MIRSQLNSYSGADPIWGFVALIGSERYTGEAAVGIDPRVRLFAVDGRVYFAEREGDAPIGTRLVNCGAVTATQLERGAVQVGDTSSLARLFQRDATIDRDAVELTLELATESLLESVANKAVGMPEVFPLRHHSSGVHHWLRAAATPLTLPAVELSALETPVLAEAPVVEESTVIETAVVVDELVVHEPVVEEVVMEVPVVEEAPIQEAVIEEVVAEEVLMAEPVFEDAIADEPVLDEVVMEEVVAEEAPIEEAAIEEEAVIEEAAVEDVAVEDVVVEDVVVEEVVAEEVVAEEVVAEEPIIEEVVMEAVAVDAYVPEATRDLEEQFAAEAFTAEEPSMVEAAPAVDEPFEMEEVFALESPVAIAFEEPIAEEPITEDVVAAVVVEEVVVESAPSPWGSMTALTLPTLNSLTEPAAVEAVADEQVIALDEPAAEELPAPEPMLAPMPTLASMTLPTLQSASSSEAAASLPDPEPSVNPYEPAEPPSGLPKLATAPISMNDLAVANAAPAPSPFGDPTHNLAAVDIWEMVDVLTDEGREGEQELVGTGGTEKQGRGWLRGRKS